MFASSFQSTESRSSFCLGVEYGKEKLAYLEQQYCWPKGSLWCYCLLILLPEVVSLTDLKKILVHEWPLPPS